MLTKFTRVAAVAICLLSCPTRSKYFYAIRDYPDVLQPWLTRVVNTGIVGYDTAAEFIGSHATDEEISMLSEAENPILRTIALYQMTHRPGYNHNQVMRTHLDDTAIIFEDMDEWGIQLWSVTDCVIHNGRWRTDAARDSLANEIILHHDGLRSAYTALQFDSLRSEYHDHITKMILRNRDYRLPERSITPSAAINTRAWRPPISKPSPATRPIVAPKFYQPSSPENHLCPGHHHPWLARIDHRTDESDRPAHGTCRQWREGGRRF
jgi:hypothetical protein